MVVPNGGASFVRAATTKLAGCFNDARGAVGGREVAATESETVGLLVVLACGAHAEPGRRGVEREVAQELSQTWIRGMAPKTS